MAQGAHTTNNLTSASSDSSSAEDRARKARILQAMHIMRKALSETSKIQLGTKFKLHLHYDEEGQWPSIELRLVEKESLTVTPNVLEVKADDKLSNGLISIFLRSGPIYGEVELARTQDFKKIPTILKSAVKEFLNTVKDFISAKKEHAAEASNNAPIKKIQDTEPRPSVNAYHSEDSMLSGDGMFLEDYEYDNIIQEDAAVAEPLAIKI